MTDLFGKRGRAWLAGVKCRRGRGWSVETWLREVDHYGDEMHKQDLQLSGKRGDERAGVAEDDSGDRGVCGDGDAGRDRGAVTVW